MTDISSYVFQWYACHHLYEQLASLHSPTPTHYTLQSNIAARIATRHHS